MTEDDKKFLKQLASKDVDTDTMSEKEKDQYFSIVEKWKDPSGKKAEIDFALERANNAIKFACKLATESNTPIQFTPHGWGNEFKRVFMTKQSYEDLKLMNNFDLDGLYCGGWSQESGFTKEGSWAYWNSSSLTC